MTSVSKKYVCIDKQNIQFNQNNSIETYRCKSNTFNDSDKEIYDNDPEFKIDDIVRIYKYKKIFAKDYTPNWSEEVFVNKKFKNHVPWTYLTIGWRRNY